MKPFLSRLVPLLAAAGVAAGSTTVAVAVLDPPLLYLSGTVVVGVNGSLPGWSSPEKSPNGFDVALAQFLAERYDFTLRLRPLAPDYREGALDNGDVDLVIANFSTIGDSSLVEGKQRHEVIDFAGPYFRDRSGVIHDPTKWAESFETGTGKICVGDGTTGEKNLKKLKDLDIPVITLSQQECFDKYADGDNREVIAVSTDETILTAYTVAESGGVVDTAVWDGYPVNDREFYGIGLPNNSPELCHELNTAIKDFIRHEWDDAFSEHLEVRGVEVDDFHKPDPDIVSGRC